MKKEVQAPGRDEKLSRKGKKKIIKTSEETIRKQREREQKKQIKNSFTVTTGMFELHTSGSERAIF